MTSMEIGRPTCCWVTVRQPKAELVPLVSQVPGFIPGWEYLVRLLRVVRDPDSTAWAARALQTFPVCYPLGLAAIESFAVNDAARLLADLIDRIAPGLTRNERPRCLAAVQKSLGAVLGRGPEAAPALRLLSSAARGFPSLRRSPGGTATSCARLGSCRKLRPSCRGRRPCVATPQQSPRRPRSMSRFRGRGPSPRWLRARSPSRIRLNDQISIDSRWWISSVTKPSTIGRTAPGMTATS